MSTLQKRKLSRFLITVFAVLTVGAMGFVLAYLADKDSAINTFPIGKVEITASEPNYPTTDKNKNGVPDDCELMIPHATIPKDPMIKNVGVNDAIVFFRVISSVEHITEITDDGVRLPEQENDLYWFKQLDDPDTAHANNFNPNWIPLTSVPEYGTIVDYPGLNEEGRGKVYIFGYQTKLAPKETTATLFDKVQNKKYGSKTISPNEVETIHIESYAIQADNIPKDGINIDTTSVLSEEDLAHIYNTFCNQNADHMKK